MLPEQNINRSNTEVSDTEPVEVLEVSDDEPIEVEDSTGDVNVAAKLPPHGIYAIKWNASKKENAVYKSKTKDAPHRAFVGAALAGAIQDEEFEGTPVYVNHINSLQRRGKTTSDLHHFLNVVGSPAPNKSTTGELTNHVISVLEESPIGMAEIDWRASYKKEDGTWADLKKTMTAFPKHKGEDGKWDGTYEQTLENPITGEKIDAQLYVVQHLTQAEATKEKKKFQ